MDSKLEDIGFYTLSDYRAKQNANFKFTPLMRCELLITSKCNFKCPYCRGTDSSTDITFEEAKQVVYLWTCDKLENIRFSGGEPTLIKWLPDLVKYSKERGVKRIAVSSNGSSDNSVYEDLIDKGVNDFSFSLDACCSSVGDMMAGNIKGAWEKVINNIKLVSSLTYVTVGVVLTEDNINDINKIISFADSLGVSDIRVISSAQWNRPLENLKVEDCYLEKFPILNYRYNNLKKGLNVRGIKKSDSKKCGLLLDDMAVKGDYHYPCVIKMREGCEPIGKITGGIYKVRYDRNNYYKNHCTHDDDICKKNCLDVCIDYNNKLEGFKND